MKTIIGAIGILVLLSAIVPVVSLGAQPAFALTAFQSGFDHGVQDGHDSCIHPDGHCHWYILLPGKGFQFHSKEFIRGYVTGWCSVPGNEQSGADADQAEFDCHYGPDSAGWLHK